jgi:hypothetical protein
MASLYLKSNPTLQSRGGVSDRSVIVESHDCLTCRFFQLPAEAKSRLAKVHHFDTGFVGILVFGWPAVRVVISRCWHGKSGRESTGCYWLEGGVRPHCGRLASHLQSQQGSFRSLIFIVVFCDSVLIVSGLRAKRFLNGKNQFDLLVNDWMKLERNWSVHFRWPWYGRFDECD